MKLYNVLTSLVISMCMYKCRLHFLYGLRLSDELCHLVLSYDNKYLSIKMLFVPIASVSARETSTPCPSGLSPRSAEREVPESL